MGESETEGVERAAVRWQSFQQQGYPRRSGDAIPAPAEATFMLGRTLAAYEAAASQWRRALGINTHERMAISHLWHHGPQPMGELGERLALSRAAMTALVDRLEQAGFVERESDQNDRRRTILHATADAFRQLRPAILGFHEQLTRHADALGPDAWGAVVGFLDEVFDAANRNAAELARLSDVEIREMALNAPGPNAD
jgi:DNA-binding MarR family transcriptional regulator